jgi:hypothetical protein
VFVDIFQGGSRRRDRDSLALALWLLPALAPVIYLQLPAKYIVPLVPAAAILVARLLQKSGTRMQVWLPRCAVVAGLVVSVLVLTGTRALAQVQREAVRQLIVPRIEAGERVWFAGHWGYHWYAEAAGAKPAVWQGHVPQPGDTIVVSLIDLPEFPKHWTAKRVVDRTVFSIRGPVMDIAAGAGYFSNAFGYLPWVPRASEASVFEVWKVE